MRSMTGYGKGIARNGPWIVEIEIKSLNHRNLSLNFHLPADMNSIDPFIRGIVKEKIERGRVDVSLKIDIEKEQAPEVDLNFTLYSAYKEAISEKVGAEKVGDEFILSLPGVLCQQKNPEIEEIKPQLGEAINEAIFSLIQMQEEEGEVLRSKILYYEEKIAKMVENIKGLLPQIQKDIYRNLKNKLENFLDEKELSEERIIMEAGVLAERSNAEEEIVRLESHLSHLKKSLQTDGPVGKKLDFIAQEILREINTLGSKVNDEQVLYQVIEMKSWVEKIREQVQNIL